jgi:glycosyltransferase involved in cell wall biosynthesis
MKLSLVVPCYNEAENVESFQEATIKAFENCGYEYEIVFIDDGSKDATMHNLRKLHQKQKCPVKVISFSRNFGKEAGIYAGLSQTCGDYVCIIDADLQQRPEIARQMVQILDEHEEYDMVAAYQDRRGESKVYRRVMQSDTAYTVAEYMYQTVKTGTAGKAAVKGLTICGKTGSAETSNDKSVETNAWYTGFIYDDNHPYAISVVIEQGGAGGNMAANLAAKAMDLAVKRIDN